MKLGRYLIVSLPDFRRHYDFRLFYQNREQFVRDMHPDKIYYWDKSLVEAYFTICQWITSDNKPSVHCVPEKVVRALQQYVGRDDVTADSECQEVDLSRDIIILSPDCNITLPAFNSNEAPPDITIKLHKIVADKNSIDYSILRIGDIESVHLYPGDVVYATECNNKFIQFLPTNISNHKITAKLIDSEGDFGSVLLIENLTTHEKTRLSNIVSFAILEDIVITIDGKFNYDLSELYYFCNIEQIIENNLAIKPICVRTNNSSLKDGIIGILYDNGLLRSTTLPKPLSGITRFEIIDADIQTN